MREELNQKKKNNIHESKWKCVYFMKYFEKQVKTGNSIEAIKLRLKKKLYYET